MRADAARLQEDVLQLASAPRHRWVPGSLEVARSYCTRQLTGSGWTVAEHRFPLRNRLRMSDYGKPDSVLPLRWSGSVDGVNLVATRRGGLPSKATWVIAHLDTVSCSPGADDNASGVAVLLQVARLLAGSRAQVAFAIVDLEELGQLGSRQLARALPTPAQVICLESVGYFDDSPAAQRLPSGFGALFPSFARAVRHRDRRADFLAVVHREDTSEFVAQWTQAAHRAGVDALPLRDRRWNGPGQTVTRWVNPLLMDLDRSDHAPFWRRQVPALMITGTAPLRNAAYHRAEDTPQTLDYERMGSLSVSLAGAIEAFATSEAVQPPFPPG